MSFTEDNSAVGTLVLIRHGESEYNAQNKFAGWVDTKLTPEGEEQGLRAGKLLKGFKPDIVYVSFLSRAIDTAKNILKALGITGMPLLQRSELMERHYGGLTGKNKAEAEKTYGPEQFLKYRRSYDEPPPPMDINHPYHPDNPAQSDKVIGMPQNGKGTEALADVVARVKPFWENELLPELRKGKNILISAHGNSLRALTMIIKGMTSEQIRKYEMANATPVVYKIKAAHGAGKWQVVEEKVIEGQTGPNFWPGM